MEDVFKTTDKKNRFNVNNEEVLNPTPMQPPLGYKPSMSLVEQIRQQVRALKHIEDTEPETEEEADDFEIDEDPAPHGRWENDMVPSIKETRARIRALEAEERRYAVPRQAVEPSPPGPPPAAPPPIKTDNSVK